MFFVPMNNFIITILCKVCQHSYVKSMLNVKSQTKGNVKSENSTQFPDFLKEKAEGTAFFFRKSVALF